MYLEVGTDSNVGRFRDHNEDAVEHVAYSGGDVLIVCDGMGGHAAGDVASAVARAAIASVVVSDLYSDPRETLFRALETAHERVLAAAAATSGRAGMGTTAVVALIRGDALFLGHVGDSRAYLVRDGIVSQLTRDQTKVQQLVDRGLLTEEGARSHPDAGVLAQAIGQPGGLMPFVTPEETGIPLRLGDALVLCSDGVYDALGPQDFGVITAGATSEEAARTLVAIAVERDGHDNASAIVALVRSPPVRRAVPPTVVDTPPPEVAPAASAPHRVSIPLLTALATGLILLGIFVGFGLGRATARGGPDPAPPLPSALSSAATDAGVVPSASTPVSP